MKNYSIQILIVANFRVSQTPLGYCCFQIICVFVEYDLFNITDLLQNLTSICFGIVLTQFNINFSRQEHQIELIYVLISSWDSRVSAYIYPFHFSFTVPLNIHLGLVTINKQILKWKLKMNRGTHYIFEDKDDIKANFFVVLTMMFKSKDWMNSKWD